MTDNQNKIESLANSLIRGKEQSIRLKTSDNKLDDIAQVSRLYLSGVTEPEMIHRYTGISRDRVAKILRAQELKTIAEQHSAKILEEIFEDKLPVLSSIADKCLLLIDREITKKLNVDNDLKPRELTELCNIVTSLDKIARLEKGKPTDISQNIRADIKDPKVLELARAIVEDPIQNLDAPLYEMTEEIKDEDDQDI